MGHAVCCECVEDSYLSKIIEEDGVPVECSVCGDDIHNAFTVEELGKLLEPIMREHFALGPDVRKFGDDDSYWDEQEGDPMSWAVQEVLGQYFDFEDEIVDAVCDAEDCWPPDGDIPFWDTSCLYVETKANSRPYFERWHYTLDELKHGRRFFSPAAQTLFAALFDGVEQLKVWVDKSTQPVVRQIDVGTKLFRARICNSRTMLPDFYQDPFKHVGPPPREKARAGRMNAEGVAVFYGALEEDTCLAEMRPALGNELVIITLETTKPLYVLDFSRLERAWGGKALSYFQPDFTEQVEKHAFLRHIHRLISQPIVPGRESDYLITQTMAEYLAHMHPKPFDGILFASSQHEKGTNVVLFADTTMLVGELFGLTYVPESIRLFSTTSIQYEHYEMKVAVGDDGVPWVYHGHEDDQGDE